MTHSATIALRAAVLRSRIGNHAARRYVERQHVPMYLYRLACQLYAARGVA